MIVAIDYGKKRCGYASGVMFPSKIGVVDREKLFAFLKDLNPEKIIFGLPFSMSGRYSCQTFEVVEVAETIFKKLKKPVFLVDERLSTKMAHLILKESKGKMAVDAVSASILFENFVNSPINVYRIREDVPRISVGCIEADSVLVHNVEDPTILDNINAKTLDVMEYDPYIAYLFKKRVRFVERFERFLEGKYDVIITPEPKKVKELLKDGGRIIRARSSVG